MKNRHLYLFALEVVPMRVGDIFDELPLHCTLMFRFWSELSADELSEKVKPIFEHTAPIVLNAQERQLLGPNQVAASLLALTPELTDLHMQLYETLSDLRVEYTAPQWVGKDYRPHVTEHGDAKLAVGKQHLSRAAYLIEVNVPGHERLIKAKFGLSAR